MEIWVEPTESFSRVFAQPDRYPGVANVVARLCSIGLGFGVLAQAGLVFGPLSVPVQAATLGGPAVTVAQAKYPYFRPSLRGGSVSSRYSPAPALRGRVSPDVHYLRSPWPQRAGQAPLIANPRAGMRKAEPATRGQELGLRFRPDERESPYYGQSAPPPAGEGGYAPSSESQAQFRPTPRRRKQTYEEMQSEASPVGPPVAPLLPYPSMSPPPLPGYGGYWR